MNLVESTIKAIIEGQGLNYFRSVNINDLNQQVGEVDISNGVGVYTSLPEIKNNTFGGSQTVLMEYSIEIFFLKLNNEVDDKGEAIDVILDELKPFVDEFFDEIKKSEIIAPSNFIDGYEVTGVDTLKMTKEVLTGWMIQMVLPIYRSDFFCPPVPPPLISPEAQEVLDNMPEPLGSQRQAVINFVDSQSVSLGSGNWQFIDAFAHGKLTANVNKLWKWKQNDSMINHGADLFSGGWNFDASLMQWIDTNFNPLIDSVNASVEDIFAGSFITRIATLDGNQPYWGNVGSASTRVQIQVREFFTIGYALTGDNRRTTVVIGSDTLLVCSRTGANTNQLYENGIKVDDGTDGVSGLGWANLNMALGARLQTGNVPAEFQDCGQSVWFWGGAIGFDQKNFYDNLAILNNAL